MGCARTAVGLAREAVCGTRLAKASSAERQAV